jgi:hypothetical protein
MLDKYQAQPGELERFKRGLRRSPSLRKNTAAALKKLIIIYPGRLHAEISFQKEKRDSQSCVSSLMSL